MIPFRFRNVCIEAFALNTPPNEVSSAEMEDRIAPLYQKLGIPFGTLEKLSGVKTRRFWDRKVMPSEVATVAARDAMDKVGFPKEHIKALINCSVTRDYFEPSTACLVHRNLGMNEDSLAFDISNACIGFSNGLMVLGNLIETGVVKAGVVVSGEHVSVLIDTCINNILQDPNMGRDQLLRVLPSFTLGSGAVAYVLCHESIATNKHKLIGAACRSATEFNDLCNGNADYCLNGGGQCAPIMETESSKLIAAAAKLGGRTWKDASEILGWSRDEVNHVFCHQVGKQVNEAFYRELGLDYAKEFTIYRKYGNLVSAALPTALVRGVEEKNIQAGEKIVLTAFGSGLNAIFTGIEW